MNEPHDCGCCKGAVVLAVRTLSERKFGWGGGEELPMREDSAITALHVFSPTFPVCFGGFGLPTVELVHDGTVELVFIHEGRELVLLFQCRNIITYTMLDGNTEVEIGGKIDLSTGIGVARLDESVAWLRGEG